MGEDRTARIGGRQNLGMGLARVPLWGVENQKLGYLGAGILVGSEEGEGALGFLIIFGLSVPVPTGPPVRSNC